MSPPMVRLLFWGFFWLVGLVGQSLRFRVRLFGLWMDGLLRIYECGMIDSISWIMFCRFPKKE